MRIHAPLAAERNILSCVHSLLGKWWQMETAEGCHTDSLQYTPIHFHTASPICATSDRHTPEHTQTPVVPFPSSWYCISFPFDVKFVFACQGSVVMEESDVA